MSLWFLAFSASAQIVVLDFGGMDYSSSNINTATPPTQTVTGDYNFNGVSGDQATFVSLGQMHTATNSSNWITPEGKTGPVIRYGFSIANLGSAVDPSMGLVRYNGSARALQNSSGAGTDAMRMASAWFWEKSSFFNEADEAGGLSFANQANSLSVGFLNSGPPAAGSVRLGRFMVQSDDVWYLSGDVFGGTTGTLSINAAASTWFAFDPLAASLLFYDPSSLGTGVAGASLNNITAIGVHVQHELFNGTSANAAQHQFNSLRAVVIPEPVTISVLLGLGALGIVLFRRRATFSRATV